eukprot:352749-Chlamydomonas_euryale.AAC.7
MRGHVLRAGCLVHAGRMLPAACMLSARCPHAAPACWRHELDALHGHATQQLLRLLAWSTWLWCQQPREGHVGCCTCRMLRVLPAVYGDAMPPPSGR